MHGQGRRPADLTDMDGTGVQVSQRVNKTGRQILVEKQSGWLLRQPDYSRPGERRASAAHINASAGCGSSAPRHSIRRPARTMMAEGVGIPRAFAVLRLTVKSTFVGCSTGRSPGFAPLKILSTWVALCGRGPKTSAPYWRSPPLILLSCAERVVRCPLAAVRRRSVRHLHVPSLPALISTIVPSGRTYWLPGAHGTDKGQPGELRQADLLSEFVGVDRA